MTDFDHHYKIQKNAGFRLGYSLISAFFCDLWILLFVQPIVNNRYIDLSDLSYTAPMWQILNFHCTGARLKNHSRNLYAPLCGMFRPNSVAVACYDALIRTKSPTNCDVHLAEAFLKHALEKSHEKYFYHNFFSVNALTDKKYCLNLRNKRKN